MRIVDLFGYGLSSPYGTGDALGQPLGVKSIGIVEVHTDGGVTGYGETYAGVYAPELIGPTIEFLRSYVIGLDVSAIAEISRTISRVPFLGRNGLIRSIASAIDLALWDIRGRMVQLPVYKLLCAGHGEKVKVYASGGSAAFGLVELEKDVRAAIDQGHTSYKLRVGIQSWQNDLKRVALARELLGDDRELMVDAIMGTISPPWTAETALQRIHDLKQFTPRWLEEPVSPDDLNGLMEVHRSSPIPIASGEALAGMSEFVEILRACAVDVLQPDVTHCGGLSAAVDVVNLARTSGVPVALHVWGSAGSLAANSHLAFALPGVDYVEVPMVQLEMASEMWVSPPVIRDGFLYPPTTDGLGIEITDQVKRKYKLVPGSGYRLSTKPLESW